MPRYAFHVFDGVPLTGMDVREFDGVREAKKEAIALADELVEHALLAPATPDWKWLSRMKRERKS
jgi:hypothetical protein